MAKKKTVIGTQITPNPKDVKVGVYFDTLDEGDYFIMEKELWQRLEEGYFDQAAINSITGEIIDDLCEIRVIPVKVSISWEMK